MKINQLKELIRKMEALPRAELPEPTLLGIGGRGYYETPTTDVLAFFCDQNGAHGLGDLVIRALFRALPEEPDVDDLTLISTPEREVKTAKGKRIDLLLEGNDWVMVIENKIFHHQNNPFSVYESYVRDSEPYKGKHHILVVLSPSGTAPKGWQAISYTALLEIMKEELAQTFIDQPLNKWLVLLREFILHLEGIMSKPTTSPETIDFVLEHLEEIKKVQDLKQKAVTAFQLEVKEFLEKEFPDNSIGTKLQQWHGFPALRFGFDEWSTASDAVLFLDGRSGKQFCINYYACDIDDNKQRLQADQHLKELDCGSPWNERKSTIRCFKSKFKSNEKTEMKKLLAHKLRLLDKFETDIRPTWTKA